MPPASPRKSSTSSANEGSPTRPRYLGIEAAGELLPPSPTAWESMLRRRLEAAGVTGARLRVIRSDGARAIVEVDHRIAVRARGAWSGEPSGGDRRLASTRTWGTLRGAKAWWRSGPPAPPTVPSS
jgi:hypothetical protein